MGCWFSKSADVKPPPYDYYHNGPLRYIGYAGHIGRACRMLLPQSAVFVPQMATTAYICADVFNTTVNSSEKGQKHSRVVINAFDILIWQILASVLIPGLVFNGIRTSTKQLFVRQAKGSACGSKAPTFSTASVAARLIPCILALCATPFIIRPIDKGVDYIMNNTYREWTKPSEDELKDPRQLAREEKRRAEKAAKEAKEACERAKKAEQERLAKIKQEEKEAKERARKKCEEEAKAYKEKYAAEQRELKEKLKKEEIELKEKQARLEQQLKQKGNAQMQCE